MLKSFKVEPEFRKKPTKNLLVRMYHSESQSSSFLLQLDDIIELNKVLSEYIAQQAKGQKGRAF
jgi:hypothetical protein